MFPYSALIFDAAGNLYGTTGNGGQYSQGNVFELSPQGGGVWTFKELHSFGDGNDGQSPWGGSLLLDPSGNLYGTTRYGGTALCDPLQPVGCGIVFELSPTAGGDWTYKVLHDFNGNGAGTDGYHPNGGLIMDSSGNLYGTTLSGGIYASALVGGTVFELKPTAKGAWKEQVLHNFSGGLYDGNYPQCTLAFDSAGNLYGTTNLGGVANVLLGGNGTVFQMTHTAGGWSERLILNFNADSSGFSGVAPLAGVIFDKAGNLYGTTEYGGTYLYGNVFELTRSGGNKWTETVLHSFNFNGQDGQEPWDPLILDATGNLYGTTFQGGVAGAGTVFKLTPTGNSWTETILHNFQDNGIDGDFPEAAVLLDSRGKRLRHNAYGWHRG